MKGQLFIEKILDFCDVPQLFVARDAFDTIYLCLLYEDEPSCKYTAIRISSKLLQTFLNGEKDLRELFENPENKSEFFDVEFSDGNYYFETCQTAKLDEDKLPLSGYKMKKDDHEEVVVHIPVSDRNLLKDLVRKFGWACVF